MWLFQPSVQVAQADRDFEGRMLCILLWNKLPGTKLCDYNHFVFDSEDIDINQTSTVLGVRMAGSQKKQHKYNGGEEYRRKEAGLMSMHHTPHFWSLKKYANRACHKSM